MNPGLIVMGASAGGLPVLTRLCAGLAGRLCWPLALVQHLGAGGDRFLAQHLGRHSGLPAVVAESFMPLLAGRVHVAPAGYHLLVEDRDTLALSLEAPVHFCRPAIDPLFMSAARVFGPDLLAVVLTGANADGAAGCARVRAAGGQVLVQTPASAEVATMPEAALRACPQATVGEPDALIDMILRRTTPCPMPISGT